MFFNLIPRIPTLWKFIGLLGLVSAIVGFISYTSYQACKNNTNKKILIETQESRNSYEERKRQIIGLPDPELDRLWTKWLRDN